MTITHLSHFGLTLIGETADNVIFAGSLADCRRMAFAHGMEVERYEGYVVSSDSGKGVFTPADSANFSRCYFKERGLIQKGQDDYSLVMPLEVWKRS